MKTLSTLILTILVCSFASAQSKKIPFFGKMKYSEICGSDKCLPTNGSAAYVADKIFFNNDYNSFLGKKFKSSPFPTIPCMTYNITEKDVDTYLEHKGKGQLEINQKIDFDANISADLVKIINEGIELPTDLKAKLITDLKSGVEKQTKNLIDFDFKIIQLKNTGEIGNEIAKSLQSMNKGEKLIVGASVISISGEWTSNTLKNIFDSFELSTGYKEYLSGEAKLKYEQSKNKVLSGSVKRFSFIIGDSYIIKD